MPRTSLTRPLTVALLTSMPLLVLSACSPEPDVDLPPAEAFVGEAPVAVHSAQLSSQDRADQDRTELERDAPLCTHTSNFQVELLDEGAEVIRLSDGELFPVSVDELDQLDQLDVSGPTPTPYKSCCDESRAAADLWCKHQGGQCENCSQAANWSCSEDGQSCVGSFSHCWCTTDPGCVSWPWTY